MLSKLENYEPSLLDYRNFESQNTNEGTDENVVETNITVNILSSNLKSLKISKYQCQECGADYKVPWTLRSHMLKKHGKRDLPEMCEKAFPNRTELDDHKSTPNECPTENILAFTRPEIMFVCKICEEIFLKEEDCNEHYKTHQTCYICMRECSSTKQLNQRILTQKGYLIHCLRQNIDF